MKPSDSALPAFSLRLTLGLALASHATFSSCGRSDTPEPMGKMEVVAPSTPAEHTYSTRGRITGLPASGQLYLRVHHEDIPDFVDRKGERIGMNEMDMEFPWITPGASLRGLSVGDAVGLTFEVRWNSDPLTLVTRINRLPADTHLNLRGFAADEPIGTERPDASNAEPKGPDSGTSPGPS